MVLLCLSLTAVSLVISVAVSRLMIAVAMKRGWVDRPDSADSGAGRRLHPAPTPNVGGVGLVAAVLVPMAVALIVIEMVPASSWRGSLKPLSDHVTGLRQQAPMAVAVIAAVLAAHVLGLIDDRRRLGPWVKLGVQFIIALLLAGFADMRVLHHLDGYGHAGFAASLAISVLWIIAITNAFNFLDNMDGLSACVGAVVAGLYLAATLLGGQWFVAAMAALVLGSLLGFLVYNFPPARLFMGDGGSLVLGLLLAVISIRTTYYSPRSGAHPGWYGVLMPVVVMAVPLYDMASVLLIRLRHGRSLVAGDRSHLSHRLIERGHSPLAAVVIVALATAATGLGGVMLASLHGWQAAIVGVQVAAVIGLLALLEKAK